MKISSSQKSFKQMVFSRVFGKNDPNKDPVNKNYEGKFERMQGKNERILKKQSMLRRSSNI